MTAQTSAGTTLAISAGNPATFNQAGFEALSFTEIGEITDISGDVGRTYNVVTHNPLKTRATVKKKGSYNSGSYTAPLALDRDDAGQAVARAALASDNDYAFCITEQNGTKVYHLGIVTAFTTSYGNVDQITSGTISIDVTANDSGEDFVVVAA